MQNYIFDDIIVDIDEILPPTEKPDKKVKGRKRKSWESGSQENIWRGVDPKDIWTAGNGVEEKEPWDAGTDADGQPNPPAPDEDTHDDHQEGGAFGDIF